ncbi:MAG TPA: hypothetical protein VF210_04325 [Pseudomonadales bacterium]
MTSQQLLPALLWTACVTLSGCGDGGSSTTPSRTDPQRLEARGALLKGKDLARLPPESPAAMREQVPADVMGRIRAHLADRLSVPADELETVRAEAVEWPNGAMGCPQPGLHYTQAIVPGYRVVLRHGGRNYDYRISESGHFVLCEGMQVNDPPVE